MAEQEIEGGHAGVIWSFEGTERVVVDDTVDSVNDEKHQQVTDSGIFQTQNHHEAPKYQRLDVEATCTWSRGREAEIEAVVYDLRSASESICLEVGSFHRLVGLHTSFLIALENFEMKKKTSIEK